MKIFIIILAIFLTGCKLNKVVNHHGIHNLEAKSKELSINNTNTVSYTHLTLPTILRV